MAHGKNHSKQFQKPLSSRNQNKFPSLTPRTTKHHHASHTLPETQMKSRSRWKSPDIKTETFPPKMNRQKSKPETFAPKIESPETTNEAQHRTSKHNAPNILISFCTGERVVSGICFSLVLHMDVVFAVCGRFAPTISDIVGW